MFWAIRAPTTYQDANGKSVRSFVSQDYTVRPSLVSGHDFETL